jgi:hypothetical protein
MTVEPQRDPATEPGSMTAEPQRDPATGTESKTADRRDTSPATDEAERTASGTAAVPAGGVDAGVIDAPVPAADAPEADAARADAATTEAATANPATTEAATAKAPAADTATTEAATTEAATADPATTEAATAEAPAADTAAAEAAMVEAATAEAPAADTAVSVETPAVAVETPNEPTKVSRRPAIIAGLRRFMTFAFTLALFVGGVALGQMAFQQTRPVPVGVDGGITVTDPPPAVTQEFIRALAANDADAMRSSLSPQPNKDLTDEFARFSIKRIVSVETLGTHVDGARSATEILLRAEKTDGLPFEVNLVILVDGGQIEGFR